MKDKLIRQSSISIMALFVFVLSTLFVSAQGGSVVSEQVKFVSLEGNLIGDAAKRDVSIYLPPGYGKLKKTRYPVVYLLHGFGPKSGGDKVWSTRKWFDVGTINRLIVEGKVAPMIVVMPDAGNRFGGGYYTNSITNGNWEDFVTTDLVGYIDGKYRTIAKATSRGIAGHSMGGYGAIKLAMKHPNIFGAAYGTSSCCLSTFPGQSSTEEEFAANKVYPTRKMLEEAAAVKTWEEADKVSLFVRFARANAAAFSPNPSKPPFFADYPLVKDGKPGEDVDRAQARWLANIPMWMIDQYQPNLLKLRGLAFDAGTKEDPPILHGSREFSEELKRRQIEHLYSEFEGGHMDIIDERIEARILPFFSRTLVF